MKRRILFALFTVSLLLLWGCYPGGPDYAEEMDVVLTSHKDYDFAAKATYAMPDDIVKITGNLTEGENPEYVPDVTAQKILARIDDNMKNLGWQKVDISANPDLLLAPAAWETTSTFIWYDYWYGWWGSYYPGWGWGGYYPYYPPVYYSSYTTGSLLMTLVDRTAVSSSGNPINQWTGLINGLMTGSYDASRVNAAIDKAFAVSPYLNTK